MEPESVAAPPSTSGSNPSKKNKGKVPKRVHKAEREKMKREHLNDLFISLANALEMSEQASGKASILNEAIRSVKDLLAQIEQHRREKETLFSESQYVIRRDMSVLNAYRSMVLDKKKRREQIYPNLILPLVHVSMEKKELEDENSALAEQIGKLQGEIKNRTMESNLDLNLAPPESHQDEFPSTTSHTSSYQNEQQTTNPVYVLPLGSNPQSYPPLCAPKPATVSKPLPRYPTVADAWPSQILGKYPRLNNEIQGCSSNDNGFLAGRAQ